eukprot:1183411-Prorocentrum_minimum.AAC.1
MSVSSPSPRPSQNALSRFCLNHAQLTETCLLSSLMPPPHRPLSPLTSSHLPSPPPNPPPFAERTVSISSRPRAAGRASEGVRLLPRPRRPPPQWRRRRG